MLALAYNYTMYLRFNLPQSSDMSQKSCTGDIKSFQLDSNIELRKEDLISPAIFTSPRCRVCASPPT